MKEFFVWLVMLFASCSSHSQTSKVTGNPVIVAMTATKELALITFDTHIDDQSAQLLNQAFDIATKNHVKSIVIIINSRGGYVNAGMRIERLIEGTPQKVVCIVDGEADSMAFNMLQSCDIRIMTKRSLLMIHQPGVTREEISGQVTEWRNAADYIEKLNEAMLEHESHKLKVTIDEVRKRTDGGREWWLKWKDAQDIGAVDLVVNTSNEAVQFVLKISK